MGDECGVVSVLYGNLNAVVSVPGVRYDLLGVLGFSSCMGVEGLEGHSGSRFTILL